MNKKPMQERASAAGWLRVCAADPKRDPKRAPRRAQGPFRLGPFRPFRRVAFGKACVIPACPALPRQPWNEQRLRARVREAEGRDMYSFLTSKRSAWQPWPAAVAPPFRISKDVVSSATPHPCICVISESILESFGSMLAEYARDSMIIQSCDRTD